jgi:hypothetical protein
MGALGLFVREVIELDSQAKDGFAEWVEPMGEFIRWMGADDSPTVAEAGTFLSHAGVEFFIYLFKETPFTSSNSELPLYRFASGLFSTLFQLFTSAPQAECPDRISLREKILYLVLQIIKSFSFYDGNDDEIVKYVALM